MPGFMVNHTALDKLGYDIWFESITATVLSPETTESAGQTEGFTGILEVLKPLVDGTDPGSVTSALAGHYDDLSDIIAKTGEAVQRTAKMYAKTESSTARTMDSRAPTVADGHDAAGNGRLASVTDTAANRSVSSSTPQSDPARSARDNMAIDVKAIDWLFHEATGHHITDPIDAIVGNWTTVQCDAKAWGEIANAWKAVSSDLSQAASAVDEVWDGNAAATFQAYMSRLTGALKGEADIANALKLLLDKVASELESTFNGALSLLQSVIHQVEAAALLLAATWWTGVGEAAAVEKAGEALDDFMKAWRIVNLVIKLVKLARTAMLAYYKVKAIIQKVLALPATVRSDIGDIKTGLHDVGAAPGVLQDIANLPKEPAIAYGGPSAPGIS